MSSLQPKLSNEYTIWVVNTRNGVFSKETYVKEFTVTLLDKNNLYGAIKNEQLYAGSEDVKYTSKPVFDVSVVNIQK